MGKYYTSKNRAIESDLSKIGLFPNTSAPWQQKVLNDLLGQVEVRKNLICLDAACGVGNNLDTLLRYFRKVFAFDKSLNAIEFAKKRYKQYKSNPVHFKVSILESMPYKNEFFDYVFCTEALEHVSDYHTVIQEIFRVTKPGGYALVSFQNHFNLSAVLKFIFEKINKKNWDVWGTHGYEGGYENYLNCFQVKKSAKKVGFILVKELGADYINAWLSWIPFLYRNYKILDRYPLLGIGQIFPLRYIAMDYFILLKKP